MLVDSDAETDWLKLMLKLIQTLILITVLMLKLTLDAEADWLANVDIDADAEADWLVDVDVDANAERLRDWHWRWFRREADWLTDAEADSDAETTGWSGARKTNQDSLA